MIYFYFLQVSLEHIRSLQSSDANANAQDILEVATEALALPCFDPEILGDIAAIANTKPTTATTTGVCSPTVNSMATMFATHATSFANESSAACAGAAANSTSTDGSADSPPLRLTGIDRAHLSDVYSQLQLMAAQSELASNDADAAMERIGAILRTVGTDGTVGAEQPVPSSSGILELGMVLSDAFWVAGDASKAEAVRQTLTDHTSITHIDTVVVQELASDLLSAMQTNGDDGADADAELEAIDEEEEVNGAVDESKGEIATPTSTTPTISVTKHVHFETGDADALSRSPVAAELNDIRDRKIATSILKGGGSPSSPTSEHTSSIQSEGTPSRPDVVQHLYHNYRSSFEFGKEHIPVGGLLLSLAEGTASTSIKIASLGQLDLQAIDEGFLGPHIIRGIDDVIANPVIETACGIVDGIGGAVGAAVSILPFVGGKRQKEECM